MSTSFCGVEHDTESARRFIRTATLPGPAHGLAQYPRRRKLRRLLRAATITRDLQKKGGASPSGLVLISPALEFALLNGEDYDPLSWALLLPSYAAVDLESKGVGGRDALAADLKGAEHYALTDYLVDLAAGAEEGGKLASGKVAELTGLPVDVVERNLAYRAEPLHQGVRPLARPGAEPL